MIDHGDPDLPQLQVHVTETVEVGPIPIFFSNQNLAMGLKSHSHHAEVYLVFDTLNGGHGYPSFEVTNDALRAWVLKLTNKGLFTNATNEDVARRIYAWVDSVPWSTEPPWAEWGGDYRLSQVTLDVHSNHDKIGHDNGVTRYTVIRHPINDYPQRYVTGANLNYSSGTSPGANSGGMFVTPESVTPEVTLLTANQALVALGLTNPTPEG